MKSSECTMHPSPHRAIESIGWMKHPNDTTNRKKLERDGVLVVQFCHPKTGKRLGLYYYAPVSRLIYEQMMNEKFNAFHMLNTYVKPYAKHKRVDINATWSKP